MDVREGSWLCKNAKTINRDRRNYSSKTALVAQLAGKFNLDALFQLASGDTSQRPSAPRALAPEPRADIGHEKARQNERAGNSEFVNQAQFGIAAATHSTTGCGLIGFGLQVTEATSFGRLCETGLSHSLYRIL